MNIRYINCSQFNVSELRVCFDECHIITGMVEKGEDYIILIGAPAKLSVAGVCLGRECLTITGMVETISA